MSKNFYNVDSITCNQSIDYIKNLMYLIGKSELSYNFFGLEMYYKRYVSLIVKFAQNINFDLNNVNERFDKTIMILILHYFLGKYEIKSDRFYKILEANIYHTSKVLLVSKHLNMTFFCHSI